MTERIVGAYRVLLLFVFASGCPAIEVLFHAARSFRWPPPFPWATAITVLIAATSVGALLVSMLPVNRRSGDLYRCMAVPSMLWGLTMAGSALLNPRFNFASLLVGVLLMLTFGGMFGLLRQTSARQYFAALDPLPGAVIGYCVFALLEAVPCILLGGTVAVGLRPGVGTAVAAMLIVLLLAAIPLSLYLPRKPYAWTWRWLVIVGSGPPIAFFSIYLVIAGLYLAPLGGLYLLPLAPLLVCGWIWLLRAWLRPATKAWHGA